jgi:hypothetical protein
MAARPQFPLHESLFATAWTAAGLALVRTMFSGGHDPAMPIVALSACCCFGAAVGTITHHASLAVLAVFAAIATLVAVNVFFT